MVEKLSLDHFVKVHEMLAGYYGGTVPNIMGCTLAFKSLQQAAPNMTNEQLDFAVMQAMTRCKFMPRIPDLMEELYERDEEHLPKLPDIDPNYADSYQQSTYYRALSERNKAKANAPFNPGKYREDRVGDIPGVVDIFLPDRKEYVRSHRLNEYHAIKAEKEAELKEEFGVDQLVFLSKGQYAIPYQNWATYGGLEIDNRPRLALASNAE